MESAPISRICEKLWFLLSHMWGDLFNRPVCGFAQSGEKRE
jgi:hypothetical protein